MPHNHDLNPIFRDILDAFLDSQLAPERAKMQAEQRMNTFPCAYCGAIDHTASDSDAYANRSVRVMRREIACAHLEKM